MRLRKQAYEYRLMKEYQYGSTEVVEIFYSRDEASRKFKEWGGGVEQEDYHGNYVMFLETGWSTIESWEIPDETS